MADDDDFGIELAEEEKDDREPLTDKDIEPLFDLVHFKLDLEKQTDRGFAIMCAADLDETLEEAILSRLCEESKITRWLFVPDGPLGSFRAKSVLAYSIGIVGKNALDDLDRIRRIRNEFAHRKLGGTGLQKSALSFGTQQIMDLCQALRYPVLFPGDFRLIEIEVAKDEKDKPRVEMKRRFLNTVFGLLTRLATVRNKKKRVPAATDY